MRSYIRNRSTRIWLFLSLLTVLSWWTGSARGADFYQADALVTGVVLLIALIKTRFVIRNYMEVRFAPSWLQLTCDAWLLCLFAGISCFYWFGS
ncbi:MAG: cytochrome C oxidase subunit IV family protein [Steroidobacteraceae bacterium]